MTSELERYFEAENLVTGSALETNLSSKLARDIRRYWKSQVFQSMLTGNLSSHYLTNIRTIVSKYVAQEIFENCDDESDDNDFDDDDDDDDYIVLSVTDSNSNDELLLGYESDDSD